MLPQPLCRHGPRCWGQVLVLCKRCCMGILLILHYGDLRTPPGLVGDVSPFLKTFISIENMHVMPLSSMKYPQAIATFKTWTAGYKVSSTFVVVYGNGTGFCPICNDRNHAWRYTPSTQRLGERWETFHLVNKWEGSLNSPWLSKLSNLFSIDWSDCLMFCYVKRSPVLSDS